MVERNNVEGLSPVNRSIDSRSASWKAAYDAIYAPNAISATAASKKPIDTQSSAKIIEEDSKKAAAQMPSLWSRFWNFITSPFTKKTSAQQTDKVENVSAVSPALQAPLPIDVHDIKAFVKEMNKLLEKKEVVHESFEDILRNYYGYQSSLFAEGSRNAKNNFAIKQLEVRALNADIRAVDNQRIDLKATTGQWITWNNRFMYATMALTAAVVVSAFASRRISFLASDGFSATLKVSQIVTGIATGITSIGKSLFEKQYNSKKGDLVAVQAKHKVENFKLSLLIEQMEKGQKSMFRMFQMMKQLAEQAQQTGHFVLSDN